MGYTVGDIGELVKRYDFEAGGFLGSDGQMVEAEYGDYVRTSDYAALEERYVALRSKYVKVLEERHDALIAAEARDRIERTCGDRRDGKVWRYRSNAT